MGWQTADGSTINKKLVRHGAFDNKAFGNNSDKVRALQTLMYAGGSPHAAKSDNRIDGKWGAQSLEYALKLGWSLGANADMISRGDLVYVWDDVRRQYIEDSPKLTPADPYADRWYKYSDPRLREIQNWINKNPGKTIADWENMMLEVSRGNLDAIYLGTEGASLVMTNLLPLAMLGGQRGTSTGYRRAPNVRSTTTETWKNPSKNVRIRTTTNETTGRGGTSTATEGTGPHSRTIEPLNTSEGLLYRYEAGARREGNNVKGFSTEAPLNAVHTNTSAVITSPTSHGTVTMPGMEVANFVENYARPALNTAGNGIKRFFNWITDVKPTPHNAGTNRSMHRNGGNINKYQAGGSTPDQQKMIQAFAQWGAQKFGKGQMSPEQFLQQFQQLEESQQKQLLQAFQQEMQGGTPMARLGAKLNYIKNLKGDCPEGQEVVYFLKGGRFCKACQDKKQKGGNIDEVANFKKNREEKKCGGKMKK